MKPLAYLFATIFFAGCTRSLHEKIIYDKLKNGDIPVVSSMVDRVDECSVRVGPRVGQFDFTAFVHLKEGVTDKDIHDIMNPHLDSLSDVELVSLPTAKIPSEVEFYLIPDRSSVLECEPITRTIANPRSVTTAIYGSHGASKMLFLVSKQGCLVVGESWHLGKHGPD